MGWIYLRENRQRVREALQKGCVDEVVTLRATAFDELAAAMYEFGYWEQLESIQVELVKDDDDVPNELLLRELAVLPLLRIANPHQAVTYLFQDHGVLRFLGFTVAQIRDGFNSKGACSATGAPRMRPHHRDDLYNALKKVDLESLDRFREAHRNALLKHDLLRSGVYAIDGTGLRHSDRHVVILQQAGVSPPFVVDWRVQGPGQELAAGRDMVGRLRADLGPAAMRWLLMDGAYVDGTWLAELQQQGIGAVVRVREDMQIYEEMRLLTQYPEHAYVPYRYVRTIQGKKETHQVELALFSQLKMWDSYRQAWAAQGVSEASCPGLWGLLIREEKQRQDGTIEQIEWGLVSVRPLLGREEAFEQWRQRWDVENRGFRELNQGGWLESQTWGRSEAAIQTSIALKIGAHNCYCLMRTDFGQQWAVKGLRSLQRYLYGAPAAVMVVVGDEYDLLTAEELVVLLGVQVISPLDLSLHAGKG
jgi:hypothetical protein